MAKSGKRGGSHKTPHAEARRLAAMNVSDRMERRFSESTNKPQALASASGVALSRVQDVLKESAGASVDTIGRIADGLRCSVADLFLPATEDHDPNVDELLYLWRNTAEPGRDKILRAARDWHEVYPAAAEDERARPLIASAGGRGP